MKNNINLQGSPIGGAVVPPSPLGKVSKTYKIG